MPKTRISCPNCRQPVVAEIEQLFDVNADPSAKQRFLSGAFNVIQCQSCGYQGAVATPLVYHDPEKDLLMTFVPPEMGLPRNEQEKLIGGLINQVVAKLPQEKRKGYLFNPQSALTLQGMVERVLEGEGITREMIQAQQQRMNLLRRLAAVTDDSVLDEIAKQEDAMMDNEFFMLSSRLIEAAMGSGDQQSARRLAELQQKLLGLTTYGKQVQAQTAEVQGALADLQKLGKDISREKVLELILNSTSAVRISALASMARPVLDYQFFQLLSERVNQAQGEEQQRLANLRASLLQMTQEIDRQMEARQQEVQKLLDALLQAPNLEEAIIQSAEMIDDFFMQELARRLEDARRSGDLQRSAKLAQIGQMIQQMNTPPEMALVEEYLDANDEAARQQFLETHWEELTPEFMDMVANIAVQVENGNEPEVVQHVRDAHRHLLRFSMGRNLKA